MFFYEKIISVIKQYRTIFSNMSYLSAMQIFKMFIPLITYPYLIRVLGSETYGLIVFVQAIIAYLLILVGFGFNTIATKEISVNRDNKEKINEIVSSVLIIKIALLIFAFLILYFLVLFIPKFQEHSLLFFLCMGVCVNQAFFPTWYFQGVEQMKYITLINISFQIASVIFILILIKEKEDYLLLPLINSISYSISGLVALWVVFKSHGVKFVKQKLETLRYYFEEGFVLFFANFFGVLKDKGNILVIGVFLGLDEVAYYDLAQKLVIIIFSFFAVVNTAFYPHFAKVKSALFSRNYLKLLLIISIFSYLFLTIFSKWIILFLAGEKMLPTQTIIYILGLWLIIETMSNSIGRNVLIVNNKSKAFLNSLVSVSLVYSILVCLLFINDIVTMHTLATALIISMFFGLCHRIFLCRKHNVIDWLF
jgi:polysaccharide transporter, PST family